MTVKYPLERPTEFSHKLGVEYVMAPCKDCGLSLNYNEIQSRVCDLSGVDLISYLHEIDGYAKRNRGARMNAGHAIINLMPINLWHEFISWHSGNRYDEPDNLKSYLNDAVSEMDIFDVYELLGLWRSDGETDD